MLRGQFDCNLRSNEMKKNEKEIRFIVNFPGPVASARPRPSLVWEMEMEI